MIKNVFLSAMSMAMFMSMPVFADNNVWGETDESKVSGFITGPLNNALDNALGAADAEKLNYSRTETRFASVPKFGGYFIGRYSYSDRDGSQGGDGFNQRLVRFYVDGTILKDFKYRVQLQLNNQSFHMKDFYLEWAKWKEFSVKVGQFKRAFGFENPMNPWDISTGDYSLLTKKFTGHGDYMCGEAASNGGRDQGIQVQGDVLKVGQDKHYLLHYQLGLWNGQGINASDKDGKKDIIGTIQVQPVKNLYIGFFGWKGTYVNNGMTYDRNRYILGLKYEKNGCTLRGEYAHGAASNGLSASDAWYATVGYPLNDWFRLCAQYQCYREDKTFTGSHCVYSLIPEFQLHKNLKLQIQYNYNNNRLGTTTDRHYNELMAEIYVRF